MKDDMMIGPKEIRLAPKTLSEQAQAILSSPNPEAGPLPHHTDREAWQSIITALKGLTDEATVDMLARATTGATVGETVVTSVENDANGAVFYEAAPREASADEPVLLLVHGGSFVHGGGAVARRAAELHAARLDMRVWSVDYRMPPEHPFPAGLDDTVAVYRRLVAEHDPGRVVVWGTSSGGNIAAALMHRIAEAHMSAPAGLVLFTPIVDLEMAGDTWSTLAAWDPSLQNAIQMSHVYAGRTNFRNPHASPYHGDLSGFPRTLLLAGTRDPVLSDTVRMHRKLLDAAVRAELILSEGEPHGGFFGHAPEDEDRTSLIARFIREVTRRPAEEALDADSTIAPPAEGRPQRSAE